jgi:hypothetical protein
MDPTLLKDPGPTEAVATGLFSAVRAYRLGKPYRTKDMPEGRYAYAVKMRIHRERGLQVRLEFENCFWSHKQWHDAEDLIS